MEFDKESWYYFSHPHEPDIFYPIWINDNEEGILDGERIKLSRLEECDFEKAIMPGTPTCSPNERAFLDEIREKGEWIKSALPGADALWFDYSCIRQSDFAKTNLSELVEVKG